MEPTVKPSKQPNSKPYLSVVAASRNDDHGGDPLIRTQIFVNTFVRQCEKYCLPAELIIVDWNPVADRPGLAAVLSVPSDASCCSGTVITVPSALHRRLKYADKMPFFQMIAKNVGIRRARGKFILATNIDIIFSDELMQFIARQKLDPKKLYRVDRYDIHSGLSKDLGLDETLEYAWANPIRSNRRYRPEKLLEHLYGGELFKRACVPDPKFRGNYDGVEVVDENDVWQIRPGGSLGLDHLHTNACGDFTLLSRDGWNVIRGYPEFEAFSFNIDSMGLVAAHYGGYQEVSLLPPCVCFHIEHGIGSGWTPEGEKKLFDRLREAGILNPEWSVLTPLVDEMRERGKLLEFNRINWGMADFDLPEQPMGDTSVVPAEKLAQLAFRAGTCDASAIQAAYDLDRLTLAYERRLAVDQSSASALGSSVVANNEKVVLYIPDSNGHYWEGRSVACSVELSKMTTVIFRLEKFAVQFPLRFDPCQCPGLIRIDSITAFDVHTKRIVWRLEGRKLRKLIVSGTGIVLNHRLLSAGGSNRIFFSRNGSNPQRSLEVISTGLDPQLILPPLPIDVEFPLAITAEMKLIPSNLCSVAQNEAGNAVAFSQDEIR